MAPNLHDPNNHAPAVSPADVWDDEGVVPRAGRSCGVVLPDKRAPAAQGPAASKTKQAEVPGLRIDVRRAARREASPEQRASIKEYGGAVVKLEQTHDEGPFQASKVIPAMELTVREEPLDLHGEGKDWGKAHRHPLRWLVAAGVGAAALLVAALAAQELLLTSKKKAQPPPLEVVEDVRIEEVKGFELDGPSEETARAMVAAYAKATTPAEVVPLIRDASRLTPRLTLDWQSWQAPADWQPAREAEWKVAADGGRSHGCLSGRKPDFAPFRVYFVRDGDALRIDWEATQGLGDASFATLQRGVGSGGVIRAYLVPENFYSLVFPEAEYRSFKLLAPDREQVVWGYATAGSATAATLLKMFESAENSGEAITEQPVTLRLTAAPKGAQKNQWLIGEMLHIDWVSP